MTLEDTLRDYNYHNGFSVPTIYTSTRILDTISASYGRLFYLTVFHLYIWSIYSQGNKGNKGNKHWEHIHAHAYTAMGK